ncbi:MAG TPA: hypothetical protein VFU96_02815 [Acidimicrobiia bacterium]|nr:hypothetical protein [Acidimicrobiia bacterium]
MIGHPAIAYLVAQRILDERREEANAYRKAKAVKKTRTIKLGSYRLTLSKEVRGVPRPV